MKASWKHYWKPTPRKMRRLGDALLATFGISGIPAALEGWTWLAVTCWILAMGGKFLTNFYKDESVINSTGEPGNN